MNTNTVSKVSAKLRYAATGFAAIAAVAGVLAASPARADNDRHGRGGWDDHRGPSHYAPHYYGPRVRYVEPPSYYYYAPPPSYVYAPPPPVIYEAPAPSFSLVFPLNLR